MKSSIEIQPDKNKVIIVKNNSTVTERIIDCQHKWFIILLEIYPSHHSSDKDNSYWQSQQFKKKIGHKKFSTKHSGKFRCIDSD